MVAVVAVTAVTVLILAGLVEAVMASDEMKDDSDGMDIQDGELQYLLQVYGDTTKEDGTARAAFARVLRLTLKLQVRVNLIRRQLADHGKKWETYNEQCNEYDAQIRELQDYNLKLRTVIWLVGLMAGSIGTAGAMLVQLALKLNGH